MKKPLLISVMAMILTIGVFGQQIENAGFEDWEDAGTVIDEPVNWSSIKTGDGGDFINNAAPLVWGQGEDAHTGNYSIELFNVFTFSIVATGSATNGRMHPDFNPDNAYAFTDPTDDRWHTVFTGHPDSVSVWAKYTPQENDTAQVKILLHTGAGTLPPQPENEANKVAYAQINIAGNVDTWTQFKAPFTWFSEDSPEYMLIVITAGNGTQAIEGSKVWYDDLELIYEPAGINDLPANQGLVYVSGNSIYLDKLPQSHLLGSTIEVMSLNASVVFSSSISSNKVNIIDNRISQGLYLVRVYGKEINYTQKVYFK
ncbi:MAG: hypothetical protein GXO89_15895 [Chlorobi bacterium]|nr:hypothetical protein [Chlorobiota bacterium]